MEGEDRAGYVRGFREAGRALVRWILAGVSAASVGAAVLLLLPMIALRRLFRRTDAREVLGENPVAHGFEDAAPHERMTKMTRLFVGNLSYEVASVEMRVAFGAYGPVTSVTVVSDRSTGTPKGFGFVDMQRREHAMAAIEGLDGKDMKGRRIIVSLARPRAERGNQGDGSRGWQVVGAGRHRW